MKVFSLVYSDEGTERRLGEAVSTDEAAAKALFENTFDNHLVHETLYICDTTRAQGAWK